MTKMNRQEVVVKLPRCAACGGKVELRTGPGRTRMYICGIMDIPEFFATPVCTQCGEESMVPEISEKLDDILKHSGRTIVPTIKEAREELFRLMSCGPCVLSVLPGIFHDAAMQMEKQRLIEKAGINSSGRQTYKLAKKTKRI